MFMIREFIPEDAAILVPQALEKGIPAEDLMAHAQYHIDHGISYTAVDEDGCVMFAAGVHYIRPGVGNVWTIVSEKCRTRAKSLIRTLQGMILVVVEECNYNKLRTNSDASFPPSQRMLKAIGFQQERRKMVSRDHYLFTRRF